MTDRKRARTRKGLVFCAFLLTFLSAALGTVFSVLKSPQARGESHLAAAADELAAGRNDAAINLVISALRLDPTAPQSWAVYAVLMDKKAAAMLHKKRAMSHPCCNKNPETVLPAYAMPAELRLSFLADDILVP